MSGLRNTHLSHVSQGNKDKSTVEGIIWDIITKSESKFSHIHSVYNLMLLFNASGILSHSIAVQDILEFMCNVHVSTIVFEL